ncbi:hypothetical protein, partial [uncultured Thiodictyon sp.]|uniref:hypothetical protein n=1 Tax=uncultured Thiodictyon sp. TaxID=1846217 RepID=UPI0025E3A6E3
MPTLSLSRKTTLAWVALTFGVLASVLAGLQVKQLLERDAAMQFAFDCDQVALKVRGRLDAYALILR